MGEWVGGGVLWGAMVKVALSRLRLMGIGWSWERGRVSTKAIVGWHFQQAICSSHWCHVEIEAEGSFSDL